jgi:polysaccharide biosynthesis/export protein
MIMNYRISQHKSLLVGITFFVISTIFGLYPYPLWSQTPTINPAMIQQLNGMSATQKQQLASQYGINMSGMGSMGSMGQIMGSGQLDNGLFGGVNNQMNATSNIQANSNLDNDERSSDTKIDPLDEIKPIFERRFEDAKNLPRYAHDLFDRNNNSLNSNISAPVPGNYSLGTGDALNILMFGNFDYETILIVDREGVIKLPRLGAITIAGLTFDQARNLIEKRVAEQMIGTKVAISMGRIRSIDVFMAGEVSKPGSYSMSGLSSVMEAMIIAGGVSEIGSIRNIQIYRDGENINSFDIYELMTNGLISGDIRLRSGDIIFVPIANKEVSIDGAIRRPARYELLANETISDLLKYSGGLTSRAYQRQVLLERYNPIDDLPTNIDIDLSDKSQNKFELMDGDILRVADVSSQQKNKIILRGAVYRPGSYGWEEGIRLSDIISDINADLQPSVDVSFAMIVSRKDNRSLDVEAHGISLLRAIENPGSNFDPLLKPFDEILIFNVSNKIDEQFFDISELEAERSKILEASMMRSEVYLRSIQAKQIELSGASNAEEDLPEDEGSLDDGSNENEYLSLNQKQLEDLLDEYNYQLSTRTALLKPILDKLKTQANSQNPIQVVSVSGAVRSPGTYPLLHDNSIEMLLLMAGGLRDDAFLDKAEVRKIINTTGKPSKIEFLQINLNDYLIDNGSETKFKLGSRDHLRVNSIPDWNPLDSIEVVGEVLYPGTYLLGINETLSSVINRAGGLTTESFPPGAYFTRESVKETERAQLSSLADTIRRDQVSRALTLEANTNPFDVENVEKGIDGLLATEVAGRLIVDLPGILSGEVNSDIVLQGGDKINIPKKTNAVTVVGEVRRAGSFVFKQGLDFDDYIQLSAGMTDRANQKAIYVIKANGSVDRIGVSRKKWLNFKSSDFADIDPGDTVVVPLKSSYQTPLNLYSQVSSVVFQSLASIAAFFQIAK